METRAWFRAALAAVALLAAWPAAPAQLPGVATTPEAAPAAAPAGPAAPQAIPLEQVFRASEELAATLRKAAGLAEADPDVEEAGRRLVESAPALERLRADLEPERLRDASSREIDGLQRALAREDQLLADGLATLEKRSAQLTSATEELQRLLASWRLTAEAARRERAPEAVVREVARAEERLRDGEERLRARRDQLLGLQGQASDLRARVARAAEAVDQAEAALERQLFEVESAPLWRALAAPDRAGGLGGQLRQALRESARDVATVAREEQGRLGILLAVVVACWLGLVALRRPLAAMEDGDPALRAAARVLARPWSAALLLAASVGTLLSWPLPPTVRDIAALALLAPLLRLLPDLVPATFRRPLHGLAALFALDRLGAVAPPRTLLARLAVLLVTAGALAGLLRGLRPGGWARYVRGGLWGPATRAAAAAALACLALSLVSNVVGNATLAERLTHATLASAILGAVLVGAVAVLEGATAALLRLPAAQRRTVVARHRELLQRRTAGLLRLGGAALWAWGASRAFGIAGALAAAAGAVLGLRLQVGGLDVSLGNVAAFVVTLALAVALSRLVRFVLDEGVLAELDLPRGVPAALSKTAQYLVLALGFSWAMLASGMEMSRFSFLVGALGVGIGFGLQNVVNNFVSGLILLYERPVQVGDVVEVGAVSGEVTRIGVRSSTVRTFPGAEVIVPNATLIATDVTNWTLSDRRRRIELAVGVAYGTEPRRVVDLLLAAVRGRAGVLDEPAPVALLLRFGESSIDFALRFWTADFDRWQLLASEVMVDVHAALGRAGIAIPFPQRDLHVRSVDPAAARALAGARDGGGPSGAGG